MLTQKTLLSCALATLLTSGVAQAADEKAKPASDSTAMVTVNKVAISLATFASLTKLKNNSINHVDLRKKNKIGSF
jgi:hypothetical protein